MTQEDLEKVICIIINNTPGNDMKEAVRLIIELVKAVEKPQALTNGPLFRYTNKITHTEPEPFRYVPTYMTETAMNTHWKQPCSTTTAMNESNLSYSATSSMKEYTQQQKKDKSLGEIFDAMDEADKATNKRGFAK